MHILSLSTAFVALTDLPAASIIPRRPPDTSSSLTLLPLNTTTLSREPWPRAPWTYRIDASATIAIEHYGRVVCANEDPICEGRVTDGIDEIALTVSREYTMERQKTDCFTGGAGTVNFWFRQETMVLKIIVEELVALRRSFVLAYGPTEVTHAGIVNYGQLAATFELTFPGIEGR